MVALSDVVGRAAVLISSIHTNYFCNRAFFASSSFNRFASTSNVRYDDHSLQPTSLWGRHWGFRDYRD